MKLIYLNKDHKTGHERLSDINDYKLATLEETLNKLKFADINKNHWITCWGSVIDNKVPTINVNTGIIIYDSLDINFLKEEPFFIK